MLTHTVHYISAEFTTTWSQATGLCPNRECGHKHRSREAAEKCADKHVLWKVYAVLGGRVVEPHTVHIALNS